MAETTTTIQVSRESAASLRSIYPNLTYDEIVQRLVSQDLVTPDTRVLEFSKLIKPSYQDEQKRQPGYKGLITAILMHFPTGTCGLVEVRVVKRSHGGGQEYLAPSLEDSFIALDDTEFTSGPLSIPVESRDTIRVEWYNYDGGFAHTVPVFVLVNKV